MSKKLILIGFFLSFHWSAFSQVNRIITDGSKIKSVVETSYANGKVTILKVPETLTLVFPADFYNYAAVFSNGLDSTKDVKLTFDPTAKTGKNLQKIDLQSGTVDLTFLNGKLWAIGSHRLDTAVAVPVDAKGAFTVKMILNSKPPEKSKPPVKTLCDQIVDDGKIIQQVLGISYDKIPLIFSACFNSSDIITKGDEVPFRYGQRLMLDTAYPKYATSASYLLIYDVRKKPLFSPYVYLKLKRDKKTGKLEHFVPQKGQFRPAAGRSLVIQIIGEKDSTYVIKTDSTTRFMDDEQSFIKQFTAQNPEKAAGKDSGSKDSTKKADKGVGESSPHKQLKQDVVSLETGLSDFNKVFNDINFKENEYYIALACVQNAIRSKFGKVPANGQELAEIIMEKVLSVKTPKEFYRDFCNHIQNVKQLYDLAINKKVTYSSFLSEMTVPDVDLFNIHIRSSKGKTDLSNHEFNVQSGLKIDFSSGIFYSSLGNATFVTGSHTFQYRDAVQTVDPSTGVIKTTYNPTLLSTTRKVIYRNDSHSFGAGFLAHAYIRTGAFFNFGLASGIFLNSSEVQGLIGPSIMLGNKTKRFCISGGIAAGQETVLSAENQQYYFDGKEAIYNSANEVPQEFSGTSTPSTAKRMKYNGWFIALTYNLSSIKTTK
ncbi:hypothetical protein FHW88_000403 [Mucilaginibacter sp. SG538B]|uniref:hypothetical protein n=1 Tax=Mucilaginibacter sp. SG538B TaxID=2587021 RepID=UPI00159DA80F|nr:hypothetical protein [Mucilaginibacter sp. SG538B]NVM62127.1 hypothetical protein [Mucilaginibacter sp. SG538B]